MADRDLEVKLDPNDVNRIQRLLSYVPKSIPKVFCTALNKTATTARKESAQKIAAASGIKVNIVRGRIRLTPATYTRWISKITVYASRIPIIKLLKGRIRDGERKFTVPTKIAMYVAGKGEPDSPFFATMPSGHFGLFDRVGLNRLPIREVFGPSLGEIFEGSQGIINAVQRNASANLAKNVEGQVRRVLAKGG
jgi:hypothetical protein